MKDEFTTKMHAEFIGDEIPFFDLCVMAVYGAMSRGIDIEIACANNEITVNEYNENVERVLRTP